MLKYIINLIDKAITAVMAVLCFVSICALDSISWIPTIVFVVSGAYLAFAAYRNGWMYSKEDFEN